MKCPLTGIGDDCSQLQMASPENRARPLNDDERDEADIADDTDAKVVAEGLANLDTVADAKVRHLAGLDCMAHSRQSIQSKVGMCSDMSNSCHS